MVGGGVVSVVAWGILAMLVGLAAIRILGFEERYGRALAIQTLTPWLYLPAYPLAVVALARGRRCQLAVAGLLVAAHVTWVYGDMPWSRPDQPRARGPEFVLVVTNLRYDNPTPVALARHLRALNPDVVVASELTASLAQTLVDQAPISSAVHTFLDPRPGAFGSGIYSRFPIADSTTRTMGSGRVSVAELDVAGTRLSVVAVHTIHALSDIGEFRRQMNDLGAIGATLPRPSVMAGDFNSGRQHRAFRAAVGRSAMRDAHDVVGRGLARTWPVGGRFPPFALLDHALVSKDIRVVSVRETSLPGTDHRAVVVRLRLPG